MNTRIVDAPSRLFVGMSEKMSLHDDKTVSLFSRFMPHVKNIENRINANVFDIQFYQPRFDFESFTMETEFIKWAAVEVEDVDGKNGPLQVLNLTAGMYAVFIHFGPARAIVNTLSRFYREWLPASGYKVDERAHLGVMPAGYKYDDPNAEEEIWVPIT